MTGRSGVAVCLAAALALNTGMAAAPDPQAPASDKASTSPAGAPSAQDLAAQASNPNAPLTQLQLRNVTAPRLPGFNGTGNDFQMQAIVPIAPSEFIPFALITKLTVPIVTIPDPAGQTELGNTQFFAQGVFKESWGSWGIGFSLVAPTDTFKGVPSQGWQIGPAAAIVYTGIPNLVLGGVFQNPITVDIGSFQSRSNALLFTPSITYTLPDGWFAGYPDFNWTANWKDKGSVTFPVGLQVGKVVHIGRQPFNLSVEAGYNVVRPSNDTGVPRWMIGLEFTALFPGL